MEKANQAMIKTRDENLGNRTSTKIEFTAPELSCLQYALLEAVDWNEKNNYNATANTIRALKAKIKAKMEAAK